MDLGETVGNFLFSATFPNRFIRSVVDLTWTIEYAVQAGRSRIAPFEWLLPLIGLGATGSGIDRRVFVIVSTLVLVTSWLVIAIPGFKCAGVAGAIASTS